MLIRLLLFCGLMFLFSFLLIPIYSVVCRVTGLNGKVALQASRYIDPKISGHRTVLIQFIGINHSGTLWQFWPVVDSVMVRVGELKRVHFFAKNITDYDGVVQAVPSIAPGEAALFFHKTECFCFTRQFLAKGESADFPLVFYLDPSLPKYIKKITLSYTLFDRTGH